MQIRLSDKEVREALVRYVQDSHREADIKVIQITRHHGGTVSAHVQVNTK